MKVLKMRGFYKPEKKMYYVLKLDQEGSGKVTLLQYALTVENNQVNVIKKESPLADVILLAYTGRKSKSGLEIYEGDLLKYGNEFQFQGIVKWNSTRLTWVIEKTSKENNYSGSKFLIENLWEILDQYIEIIGNKYLEG